MQQYICINYIIVKNKYFVLYINKYKENINCDYLWMWDD